MLVFDTETRVDQTQRLTFGSYRFLVAGRCLEEGLFYGDDLPATDHRILERYVADYKADTVDEGVQKLALLTRREFIRQIYRDTYKARCLLVAFNWPFDISRLAWNFTTARGQPFTSGFSLELWSYFENGQERVNRYRPAISIKQIDSKRALKGFTGRKTPDREDRIPDDSETGEPEEGHVTRGNFLDLRTLAFALTDKGHTLESACKAFSVAHGKQHVSQHGVVTKEYIDYNRRDVLATSELAVRLLQEYSRHPIKLQVTKAYSPASIGKSYLRAMGIKPVLERQPDFPKQYLGFAATAFFGGRTSAHIRKIAVPVVYTDFLSMYPTVNSLMDLWRFVTAQKIEVVEHCQAEIQEFLNQLKTEDLFNQATWKFFAVFVQIIPDGDILPSRAKYNLESHDWQVAVNYLYADRNNSENQALWFSLPDIIASVILTGRVPKILDAFRLEAIGKLKSLKNTELLGSIDINPETQDFFRVVIEQRKSFGTRKDISKVEKQRLEKSLKVLANAASYGIYAEMHRRESNEKVMTTYHGIDSEPITRAIQHADEPGEYCFPPLASLITGAARLMLALLEHSVTKLGGIHAMEDTDSMAIVATEHGGIIPCYGGSDRTDDGREGIKALSWKQVDEISEEFSALNPYDRKAVGVPRSILKVEDDNYRNPKTREQRQIYCYAISAKRYTLFLQDNHGTPVLLREGVNNEKDGWSEHGLGHLLNPTDPESEDRDWISQIWSDIVFRALGFPAKKLSFLNSPAVGRVTIGSPAIMKRLKNLNDGKKYPDRIKPFNFLLTSHVMPFGHPPGTDPERFQLIAPYESDSRKWLKMDWINQYSSGNRYRISTSDHYVSRQTARVKTYGDVLREYEFHPETKCADSRGHVCDKETIGLLQRRHIRIQKITYIGKESNTIEDVQSALVHSAQEVYTEYPDPKRDEWATKYVPALERAKKKTSLTNVASQIGISRRELIEWLAGRSRPHPKNQERIAKYCEHSF
jgi:hypothetical protein